MTAKTKKRLVLIDSHALIHRAFHALPPLNTPRGELVNAVFGFLSILFSSLKELKPEYVAAAFDLPKPTFRHEQYAAYKATRQKAPDELYAQIGRVKEALIALNVPILEKEGFEADDILGTICEQLKKEKDLETYIVTGDLDTLQLINDRVKVFTLKKGIKDTQVYDAAAVEQRYALKPDQMVDFKALRGDPSDNVPGVSGVGEKTASDLMQKFGTLDNLYKKLEKSEMPPKLKERLLTEKEQAYFSRELVAIRKDAPIKFVLAAALWRDFEKEKIENFLKELRFNSLIQRLNDLVLGEKKTPGQMSLPEKAPAEPAESRQEKTLREIEELRTQGVLSEKIYQVEKDLAPVLRKMEETGILLKAGELEKLGQEAEKELASLEKEIHRLAGTVFNVNSPQQLSEILFDRLKLDISGLKKTPGKVISTAFSELLKLREKHEIVDKIISHRELAKLKNTYLDALPKLAGPDGRLRTSFDQLGTATGRLSSKEPNLQNIPVKSDLGQEIRKAFIAPEGFRLLSADYSQVELRVVASIAQDKEMLKVLKAGRDIHASTAAAVFGVAEEEVTAAMRKAAKVLNFGMIYGMSIKGFAEAAGLERKQAKEFMEKYFQTFSGVAGYIEKTKKAVSEKGFVETVFGRKRFLPEINSASWNLRAAAERMAVNMPVQGTSADIIKMAMVEIAREIEKRKIGDKLKMILQVHDELIFEVRKEFLPEAEKLIKKKMETVPFLESPLKVDFKRGESWGEMT